MTWHNIIQKQIFQKTKIIEVREISSRRFFLNILYIHS